MEKSFKINHQGITESDDETSNLLIYTDVTSESEKTFLNKYDLPKDVFYFDNISPIAPRYEKIQNKQLGETIIFVFTNIVQPDKNSVDIEERLETHVFVLGEEQMFWFIKNSNSNLASEVIEKYQTAIISLESVILYAGLQAYTHFTNELMEQKERIDNLNQQADHTTSNRILLEVTETERNLVMLEHTIDTQEEAFQHLLKDENFLRKLDNPQLVHDIEWYNRQVKNLVHVYKDLFDAVSSLFTDIVSNNLNLLMKFLSSLSLILAASSLIAGLWGMNTGGLPFEEHGFGTYIMLLVAFLAGLAMYLFLKNQKFFDD